jgi:hypothetical protein
MHPNDIKLAALAGLVTFAAKGGNATYGISDIIYR